MRTCLPFHSATAAAFIVAAIFCTEVRAQAVVQAEPVVVNEGQLVADAAGTSQVRLADSAPVAVRSLAAMADNVANLHVNASGAGSFGSLVSLRGLANTPYFSDPSVAVYFDDIPLGSTFTYPVDLLGFTTATVSRGPQPSAAGRAAEGGLIVFSSPAFRDVPAGTLRAGLGNYNARYGMVEYQTTASGVVAGSVAAGFSERDGFIDNTQLHTRVDDQQATTASARLRLRPTSSMYVGFQLLVNDQRNGAQPLVPLGGPSFSVARGREGSTDSRFAGGALNLSFSTPIGWLRSITSHTRWSLDPYDNRLVLPPPLDSRLTQTQSAWNEELRLGSNRTDPLSWHAGAWFSDTDTDGSVNRAIPGLFPIEGSSFDLSAQTAALFGDLVVPIGSGWQITAAARAEETKKDFVRHETVPKTGHFAANRSDTALLPKVIASYAFNPAASASLSVGLGRKPGGWSAYTDNPVLAAFRPEKVVAYEAGVDASLADRTVKIAARVFDYEVRDYQIERSFNATDYLVVNAPRARSNGAELEASWHPLPEWTINASLGLTDTTLREFTDPFTGTSYAGRRAPYTPDHDAHLGFLYHPASGWFVGGEVIAIGRTYYDEGENLPFASPAHTTGNLLLGYEQRSWRVALHAENIADVQYAALVIPGVGHKVPGNPRTVGIEVAWKW